MRKIVVALIAVSMILGLISCTMRLTDFTVLSTKNIDFTHSANFERGKSRVEGEDVAHILLFIPIGVPNMKEAVDRAIESVPGAVALVDGVLSARGFWIFLYGQNVYIIEGTPLIDKTLVTSSLESNYIISRSDSSGNVISTHYVSKDEYMSVRNEIYSSQ